MINNVSGAGAAPPTSVLSAGPGGKMGKDEFLKLFVTQLRNQDPTNPMNGEQLAAQLAQFTSVEQLMNISEQLQGQATQNQSVVAALANSNAAATLGRVVTAAGDQVLVPESGDASVAVEVGGAGGRATLRVFDASGREVGSRELGEVAAGRQSLELGSAATGLPAGRYTYTLEVADASGAAVPVQTYTVGRVDGFRSGPQGPILSAGPLEIPLVSVVEVSAGN